MKRISNIFALTCMVVTFVGCQEVGVPNAENEIPMDGNQRYIHFDTSVSTRGTLYTDNVLTVDFYVLGYQYPYNTDGGWATAKALATPNVFDDTPTLVEHKGNYFSYGEPKPWTSNKYSFFAYYASNYTNVELFDDGSTIKTGEPYITYTLPSSTDPSSLVDLMTAGYIDTDVKISQSIVMNMHHRLASVDVAIRNYDEIDHDGDQSAEKPTPKVPVTIEITELSVNLNNITNTSAKIYLNPDEGAEYPEDQYKDKDVDGNVIVKNNVPTTPYTFTIVGTGTDWAPNTFDVNPNSNDDSEMRFVTNAEGKNISTLLLIPQITPLKGEGELYFKKKYKVNDNDDWIYIANPNPITGQDDLYLYTAPLNIDFKNRSLLEGRRYFIEISFTSDVVSVNIISADEWDESNQDADGDGKKDNIDYEFE